MAVITVDDTITDAITQTNVMVTGQAPAMALAQLYQTLANSFAMASFNAVFAQQQTNIAHQTATTEEVIRLLSLEIR
jgi:Killing trait